MKKFRNLIFLLLVLTVVTFLSFLIASLYPDVAPAKPVDAVISQEFSEWNPDIGQLENKEVIWDFQNKYVAYRLSDIDKINTLQKVNYIPDQFVHPDNLSEDSVIVDLNDPNFHFAKRGSIQIIVLNLDPNAPDFRSQANSLVSLKKGDSWHVSLAMPKILSACNIYQKFDLCASIGEIEDYHFIHYTSMMDEVTKQHKSATDTVILDLPFYTRMETMTDPIMAAQLITVHYEAKRAEAGPVSLPIIGTTDNVFMMINSNKTVLTAFIVIALIAFVIFAFLCILKKTLFFFSHLCISFGIFIAMASAFFLMTATKLPYMWASYAGASMQFAVASAVYTAMRDCKRFPMRLIMTGISGTAAVLLFIMPFVSTEAAHTLNFIANIISFLSAVAILICSIVRSLSVKESEIWRIYTPSILSVVILLAPYTGKKQFAVNDPLFWMVCFTVLIAFVISYHVFTGIERHNRHLTANLQAEVAVQTKHLSSLIEERENLLRIVSHDLSKPLISAHNFLDILDGRVEEKEEKELVSIIRSKNDEVLKNLSDIAKYQQYSYLSEPAETVSLTALCYGLYQNLQPDCNADGVTLKNHVPDSLFVYAKPKGLESAIFNIIFNALEHADCTEITLSAVKSKNKCTISIADNGHGITTNKDIFAPYVSEKEEEGGLGLYICREMIRSMNGELSYETSTKGTTFKIILARS